jgi:hypothetical protein
MSTDPSVLRDQREFNERIVKLLEHLKIPYGIGGSVASMSYSNTARFTNDVDVMFDTNVEMLELLVAEVEQWQVYIDPVETILEFNFPARIPINIMDGAAGTKADLFVVEHTGLDASIMSRLRRRKLYVQPDFYAWFLSPEDVILYKLIYFKKSDGNLQKHPADILSMLRAVEHELDSAYLDRWAREIGVIDMWQSVLDEFHQ